MSFSAYQLNKLSLLTGVEIFLFRNGQIQPFKENSEYNPIYENEDFRNKLMKQAENQDVPLLYQDILQIFFGCIKSNDCFFIFGPMSLKGLDNMDLHKYYRHHGLTTSIEKTLPKMSLSKILIIIEMIAKEVLGKEYQNEVLISENNISQNLERQLKKEQAMFRIQQDELYHHTYHEELKLLNCVREGNVDDALKKCMDIDMEMGKLSSKEITHWKNVVIVAVTLCTRAAIEGGVSPDIAYNISDFYIQKCEQYNEISDLILCRNQAVKDLSEKVKKRKGIKKSPNYVEQCKDYINKHYREKIYISDMAKQLNLSTTYLSRLFKKTTNKCIQDYINDVRIERASNLLIYSNESIPTIAGYVNFPSQSYFGKIFKSRKNMTPKQYRDKYRPAEFIE